MKLEVDSKQRCSALVGPPVVSLRQNMLIPGSLQAEASELSLCIAREINGCMELNGAGDPANNSVISVSLLQPVLWI